MMQGLIASLKQQNALYPVDKKDGTTMLKPTYLDLRSLQ
jgi:hypothetical protein